MSKKIHDDATGLVIDSGRSYQIGIHYGDDDPKHALDYANIEDLLNVIREALTTPRSKPPLQIIVMTWEHFTPSDPRPEWQQ